MTRYHRFIFGKTMFRLAANPSSSLLLVVPVGRRIKIDKLVDDAHPAFKRMFHVMQAGLRKWRASRSPRARMEGPMW
jgi:hypothetical protein